MTTAIQIIQFILFQCVIEIIHWVSQTRDIGDQESFTIDIGDQESFVIDIGDQESFAIDIGDQESFDQESFAIDIGDQESFDQESFDQESFAITIDETPAEFTPIEFVSVELAIIKPQEIELYKEPVIHLKRKLIRPHLHSRWAKTPRTIHTETKRTFTTVFGTTYSLPTKNH
jgi:hypothetical protein